MSKRPEFMPFLLAAICLLGVIGLSASGRAIPAILEQLLFALVVGGAAVTHPGTALTGIVDALRPSNSPQDPPAAASSTAAVVVSSESDAGA
jgi:hypothetical protein